MKWVLSLLVLLCLLEFFNFLGYAECDYNHYGSLVLGDLGESFDECLERGSLIAIYTQKEKDRRTIYLRRVIRHGGTNFFYTPMIYDNGFYYGDYPADVSSYSQKKFIHFKVSDKKLCDSIPYLITCKNSDPYYLSFVSSHNIYKKPKVPLSERITHQFWPVSIDLIRGIINNLSDVYR